ncbi:extracellular solute-binding protein [Halorientalis marina]|uniref:extracellular solute-binding protein n=1 Tax=Halorientalis marina TaxID=2931976 RepID=UPI001FF48314|nr:extracellular solute-binding protein [Halorientalis marina]
MDRRRYLALVGAAAAVAGCSGGGEETTTGETDAATDTDAATATDSPTAEPTAPPTDAATATDTETATAEPTDTETEDEPAEQVTLTFAAAPVEADAMGALNDALQAAGLREDVTLELRDTDERGLRQQAREWTAGGRSAPDLIVTDAGWTRSLLRDNLGVRLDARSEFPDSARERVRGGFDATVETVTDDAGAIRAVPLHVGVPTIAYRQDRFQEGGHGQGADRATTPMTWQAFGDVINDVVNQTGVPLGFGFRAARTDELACCLFNELLTSWGGAYFGRPDRLLERSGGRPVTAGNEPARNAMSMLRTFMYDDDPQALDEYASEIASPDVLDWSGSEPRSRLERGNAAAIRAEPDELAALAASSVGSNVGAMPLPYAVTENEAAQRGAGGSSPSMGGWNVLVNPRSDDVSAAVSAAAAMTTDEFHLAMLERSNFVPPRAALLETDRARNADPLGEYLPTLQWSAENAIPRPSNRRWYDRMSDVVEREVHDALSQEQNPTEAARGMASRLRRFEG